MNEFNYMEALERTITEQEFEVDELRAHYEYLESFEDTSEEHIDRLADCMVELLEAIEALESARKYVESQRQYA